MFRTFVLILALTASRTSHAQVEERRFRWAVLPGVFYQQETSVGFAAFGSLTYRLEEDPETWASSLTSAAVYTLENQASLSVWANLYLGPANRWGIESAVFLEHFPTNYFGIGPEAEPSYQLFTRRQMRSDITIRRRVAGSLFLGAAHHLAFVDVPDVGAPTGPDHAPTWTDDDQLDSGNVPGGDGTRLHGLGLLARWDTRDNNQSTHRGASVDLEVAQHPRVLGSLESFGYARIDVRGFVPVRNATVGVQSITQLGWGQMPFTSMFELGGDRMLRGMFQGRFRDRGASTHQLEVRHPLIWKLGVVGFVGAGHVFDRPAEITRHPPRWTAGGGLRFELDPETRNTIRLDVGAGPDGTGFIFTFGEAF